MLVRLRPHLILVLLWAAYFHPLMLHPDRVLYADYSDFLAEHLPAKIFLNREWREAGELPRWNPYHFCGSPFVHDIQVGAFYPPYAVMYFVPESVLGAALSWVVALHVLAAGLFTFVYARWRGLGQVGALVAAVGFMLSAKWMTHLLLAGHTITVGLAWLPLILLAMERAIRSGGTWPVIGSGVGIALLVLGTHPQWALYAAVFVALWTLGPALERAGYLGGDGARSLARTGRELARWAGLGLAAGAVGAALTAVQWLPTLEAAAHSIRAGGVEQSASLSSALSVAIGLVGPSSGYDPAWSWDERGLLGVFALTAVLAAPSVAGRPVRWQLGVVLVLVAFALAGEAAGSLPGFRLFRTPARMLLVVAFPVAFLAGVTTDGLMRTGWDQRTRAAVQRALLAVIFLCVIPAALFFGSGGEDGVAHPTRPMWGEFAVFWAFVAAAIPVAFVLTLPVRAVSPGLRTGMWITLLVVETVIPTARFVHVREQERIYPRSALIDELTTRARVGEARVGDWHVYGMHSDRGSALGLGVPMALVYRLESPNGYNPLDVRWYREFVWYTTTGRGPVRSGHPVTLPVLANPEHNVLRLIDVTNLRYEAVPDGALTFHKAAWRPVAVVPGPPPVPLRGPAAPTELPSFTIYENPTALPRAWVVPEAARMPAGREGDALDGCDFRRTVLLTTDDPLPSATGAVGTARVVEHRPNRVVVRIESGSGYLVLSDVWYPGWVCRVDGNEVPVYRANHAFRAVALPTGATEAVFTFEPRSYRIGWWVSCAALVMLVGVGSARLFYFKVPNPPVATGGLSSKSAC